MRYLILAAVLLAIPGTLTQASFAPIRILLSDVVKPPSSGVTVCDMSGCVRLTRAELWAVVRDL